MMMADPGNRPVKVLYVIDGLGTGGAERSLAELLPALEPAGISATVACLHRRVEGIQSEVVAAGADVRFLPPGPLAPLRALRRIVTDEQPDLVHTTIFASNLFGRLASLGSRAVVLTSLVNTPYAPIRRQDPRIRPIALSMVRMIDVVTAKTMTHHFHAITEAVKRWAVADMGIASEQITVIHRGRDPRRLGEPSEERKRGVRHAVGLRPGDEVVLNVGRQEYQKGQRHLVEAIAELAPSRPNLRLVLAGRRGASSDALDALVRVRGLAERVRVLGHRDDVPDLLAAADIFAFPSLYEGLGGSVLEAMALGLPIVATDIPAVREVVEEGRNAVLVPTASPSDLSRALKLVLDQRELAEGFGRRSREIFLRRFTSDRSTEAMLGLYRQLAMSRALTTANER
jgi:glycosyltransferase involved in cell wall biosynthesis